MLRLRPEGEAAALELSGATFTIGRGADNDLVVDDPKVSRHHAMLYPEYGGGYSLIDLGSTNGTFVDGARVVLPRRLRHLDQLRVGTTALRFEDFSASDPTASLAEIDGSATLIDFEECYVAVLVADVRGYSKLAQQMPLDQLSRLMGQWFRSAAETIRAHGGMIDHFIGDAVMAVWLVDRAAPAAQTRRAVQASLALQRLSATTHISLANTHEDLEFRVGIGLNAGEAALGNIGEDGRRDFTTTGDTVNVAFRLQGLSKSYPFPILASAEAEAHVRGEFSFTSVGDVRLRGRHTPTVVFGLLAATPPA